MASLADLLTFRDKLLETRFSGVQTFVDQNGERVTYRSEAEIGRALAALESEIAAATRKPSKTIKFNSSKGL
ncbi:phage head-tail joining protein [Martelella radicis]|uniref:Uncharacterized protein n=1 Tax=Martelella radicis TaxID=1397476 RepID=A0A7W6KFC1_9HYPH|nr:hypothetical protein [Martelella radicis]MBB4120209.1 hypothetical protein [Martelella radicis]